MKRRAFVRNLVRLLATVAALLALTWTGAAGAMPVDGAPPSEMPPRDVNVVVQPSALKLPSLPDDFERLETGGWLTIEAPFSVHDKVQSLLREGEEFRNRLSEDLGQAVLDHVLVRVARNPEQMAELAPPDSPPPPYAAGVAYPSVRLAILALQAPETWEAPDLTELLGHELTHLALADAVGSHHVPRWFDEGFAIHESDELPWARTKTLWTASIGHHVLPLSALDRGFPSDGYDVTVAYAESADFVRFLMRDSDRARFGSLVERVRTGTPFDRAMEDAYGTDVRKLEYEWRDTLSHRFSVVPMLTGGGALWVIMAGLSVAAWAKKRRAARLKLEQWAREEAELEAAMASAAVRTQAPPAEEEPPAAAPAVIPVIEHDGHWYTLH